MQEAHHENGSPRNTGGAILRNWSSCHSTLLWLTADSSRLTLSSGSHASGLDTCRSSVIASVTSTSKGAILMYCAIESIE